MRALALFLTILSPAAVLRAAEPPELPTIDDQVVVTASLVPEAPAELPATVRVIDRETLERRQSPPLAAALGALPGLQVVRAGGPGQQASLFVRGAQSDQVLVLWNGVPLNDPFFGAFNGALLGSEGVERVEVVPGPFSALYGSSAMGGVVQVVTRRDDRALARLEAGEREHFAAAAEWGGGLGSGHGFVAARFEGGDGELVNDRHRAGEASGRLGWGTPALDGALLVRGSDLDVGLPSNGFAPTPRASIAARELLVGLPVDWTTSSWGAEGLLSRTWLDQAYRDDDDPFSAPSFTDAGATRARFVGRRFLGGRGWWAAGGEWERLEADTRSPFATVAGARQETTAAFTQLHLTGRRGSLELGVRHDDNDVHGRRWSPRLGGTLALSERVRLRASYGEAHRAPSLGELFYPFFGNPELRPEESRSGELGLAWTAGAWRLDLVGFESRSRDLIDFDAAFRSVNVGRARSRGVEALVGWRRGAWDLRLALAELDAEDLGSGEPLRRRADHTATFEAGWSPGRWSASLVASWVGERPDTDPRTGAQTLNPSWARIDLAARRRLGRFGLLARVENLLDERYEPALGFPAPGRRLIAGGEISW